MIPKNLGLSGPSPERLIGATLLRLIPDAPNFFVLQAGVRPPNSAELLGSPQMHEVLEECKAEYDHVIIDSAPCLIVTDAVLVAQETDAVLLVSRIAVTPRSNLRRASELLQFGEGHVTGIVANDVPDSRKLLRIWLRLRYGKYNSYYSRKGAGR